MSSVRKILLVISGVVVGVFLLLIVALKLFLTDERLRSSIEPVLEDALGREVTIGRLEARLLRSFPDISVGADSLFIHTPDDAHGSRPDLASVERVWVDLSLVPLLQGKIHLNAVDIVRPLVLIEVYDDLSTNLIEMGTEGSAAEATAQEELKEE